MRWERMGKNVKIPDFLRWLQLSKGKYLAFCRVSNSYQNSVLIYIRLGMFRAHDIMN